MSHGPVDSAPQDSRESAKFNRAAAERGEVIAQYNLGLQYYHGNGVPKNYVEAIKWFRKASEHGDVDAQFSLGSMYSDGLGVPRNYIKSEMWLSIAIANADSEKRKQFQKQISSVVRFITDDERTEAEKLAKKCIAKKYKGC